MGANVWAVVGGSTFQLPMETLLGTANQLLGMNPGATELQYKDATFDNVAGQLAVPVGAVGTPPYTFTGFLTSGFYFFGGNSLGVSIGGVRKSYFDAAGQTVEGKSQLVGGLLQEDTATPIAVVNGTTDLAAVDGNVVTLTNAAGANAISSLGGDTIPSGTEIETIFSITGGSVTLTHNAVSLPLLGAADIILLDGDMVRWRKTNDASPYWRMMSFARGSLSPFASNFPVGTVVDRASANVPAGWLECDGTAVSRVTYAALFAELGITWGAGDGVTTFNLPPSSGRTRIGRGTGTVIDAGADAQVDIAANELIVPSNNKKWITGMPVVFTLSSGTVTGLTSGLTYYIIRMSATTVSLASSLANAQNNVEIDFTAKAAPVWTITHTFTAKTIGETGGEQNHAENINELLSHLHFVNAQWNSGAGTNTGWTAAAASASSGNSNATGGNTAANIESPYGVFLTIIKT